MLIFYGFIQVFVFTINHHLQLWAVNSWFTLFCTRLTRINVMYWMIMHEINNVILVSPPTSRSKFNPYSPGNP